MRIAQLQQGGCMFQEFRAFISRGNVLDLAVAVIIGAAFGKIVTSLTDDLIMPIVGLVTGGADFSSKFIVLGTIPATYTGSLESYTALKAAGVALFGYGAFLTAVINFVIIAFVIFQIVRTANKINKPAAAGPTPTEALLAEIRDELKIRKP
jgi:large conductance mechanosensitive channel